MRLWYYKLIPYLPREQLISQLRENVAIAKAIYEKGSPNHILVNKVTNYNLNEFYSYCWLVFDELDRRGYKYKQATVDKIELYLNGKERTRLDKTAELFPDWHNIRYLVQCYCNLQEKYDCGGISEKEWNIIYEFVQSIINSYCACK